MTILRNYSLKQHNTFGLEAKANAFCRAETLPELQEILHGEAPNFQQIRVLGGGSNILLTQHLDALVINIALKGIAILHETTETIDVEVQAGEIWDEWVQYAVGHNWGGVENLSLIPGSVGAAPVQNIGAYGVELQDTILAVKGIQRSSEEMLTMTKEQCRFGYRDSIFKQSLREQIIITSVVMRLKKNPQPKDLHTHYGAIEQEIRRIYPALQIHERSIYHVREAVCAIRRSKLPNPAQIGNAGSFFKNPEIPLSQYQAIKQQYPEAPSFPVSEQVIKLPAAWLIEQCGWKGKRLHASSDAAVHDKQALVLVNYGAAKGEELLELSRQIQQDVQERFGVVLSPEVNVW